MAHIRSRRRSCWFLLCFCGWFLDGLCLKRDAWWEKNRNVHMWRSFSRNIMSWTLLASNARVLCCPYHSKIMPSCENMEVQVAMQHRHHSHSGVQFWNVFPACWSTWWSGKHPTISRASFILLGANALQPKHMYHIHVFFAMCVYMKVWNGKRKHISGKNSITPGGGPCQPKRGQEKILRCKIAKWINEISWEILQLRCGLSSYHPALARLGYQDSWIV